MSKEQVGVRFGLLIVPLILLLAPAASAHAPVLHVAPYSNVVKSITHSVDSSGCATAKSAKPTWSASTGKGGWLGKVTAKTCSQILAGAGGLSYGDGSGGVTLAIPLHVFNGSTSVAVAWKLLYYLNASTSVFGSCPTPTLDSSGNGHEYCTIFAYAAINGFAELVDTTNGSIISSSNYWNYPYAFNETVNDTNCAAFSCSTLSGGFFSGASGAFASAPTWWMNSTLNHSDSYAIYTYMQAYVDVSVSGDPQPAYSGSSAVAVVSLSKLSGNGWYLASILVA